jgi:trans-2,3-dihydro-3-hydroxyanthranilate isomerase
MKKLNIFRINAFSENPFAGNPAAVLRSDNLSDQDMGRIAKEMNLSETAFLSPSEIADYKLRWFTPSVEVDLCGHATIASLHFLKENGELNDNCAVRFETRSGIIRCCYENEIYYMQIPGFNFMRFDGKESEVIFLLGMDINDLSGDFFLLDNGYLYIQIISLEKLGKINPDFSQLMEFSIASGIQGITVFTTETFEEENSAHLRFFSPAEGINEDPVTGSANGPLIKILMETGHISKSDIAEVNFEQGDFLGRPGRVNVSYRNGKIFIAGKAVTFLKGDLFI